MWDLWKKTENALRLNRAVTRTEVVATLLLLIIARSILGV